MNLDDELWNALTGGRLEECRELLLNGANPNAYVGPRGETLLMLADELGYREMVPILLMHGAEVNAGDYEGETALMRAVRHGFADSCRTYIEDGALVDACSEAGDQALAIAASRGNTAICAILLDAGADIKGSLGFFDTALAVAAQGDHLDTCKLLVDRGAPVDAVALQAAAEGSATVLSFLFERIDQSDTHLLTRALWAAAGKGVIAQCRFLISQGAPVQEALFAAASGGHLEACQVLLDHGALASYRSHNEVQPLRDAAAAGAADVCRLLLAAGADANGRMSGDYTPLHRAIDSGPVELVSVCSVLIEHGADPALHCQLNELTPFQLAVEQGREDVVEMFISEVGEDPLQCTRAGKSMMVLGAAHPGTLAVLRSHVMSSSLDETMTVNGEAVQGPRRVGCGPI